MKYVLPLALCALMTAGCKGDGDTPRGVQISVDSTSGHRVVKVAGKPPTLPLESVVRIGSVDGPDAFGGVRSVLLGGNGRLYVIDSRNRRLMVFDNSGTLLKDIGRAGEGPGEYSIPYSVAWHGDTLVLLDPGNSRLGRYDAEGEWLGSTPSPRLTGSDVRLYRLAEGSFATVNLVSSEQGLQRIFVTHSGQAEYDSIPVARPDRVLPGHVTCEGGVDNRISFFSQPFSWTHIAVPAGNGMLVSAFSDSYRLAFLKANGDTAMIIERDVAPAPISDEEWDQSLATFKEWREKNGDQTCKPNFIERTSYKPLLEALFFDDSGNLWVDVNSAEGRFFEVFNRRGELTRRVQAVDRQRGIEPHVLNGRMVVVEADSLGVQYVRVYRTTPGTD